MTGTRRRSARPMSEATLQAAVLDLAALTGWWHHHEHDSRRGTEGLPDLLLIRPPRLLWRELKTDAGKLRPEQVAVLGALTACGQDADVWRPDDLRSGRVQEELRRPDSTRRPRVPITPSPDAA